MPQPNNNNVISVRVNVNKFRKYILLNRLIWENSKMTLMNLLMIIQCYTSLRCRNTNKSLHRRISCLGWLVQLAIHGYIPHQRRILHLRILETQVLKSVELWIFALKEEFKLRRYDFEFSRQIKVATYVLKQQSKLKINIFEFSRLNSK